MTAPAFNLLEPEFLNILSTLSLKLRCHFLGTQTHAHKKGTSIDFGGHRSYSPGDDLRYLDWNIYGRLEQLFLKEFEAEENFKVVLYFDRSLSMDYGTHQKLLFSKKLAALLGYLTLIEGNQLLLISSVQEKPVTFVGPKNILPYLQYLQNLSPLGEDFDRVPSFQQRGRSLGIILSDLYRLEPEKWFGILTRIHYQLLTIHLVDPQEQGPLESGWFIFRDRETQEEIRLHLTPALAKSYQKKFTEHLKKRESSCHALGSSYLRLETNTPFDSALGMKLFKTGVFK